MRALARVLTTVLVPLAALAACSPSTDQADNTPEPAVSLEDLPADAAGYELTLVGTGSEPRRLIAAAVPVGSVDRVAVSFDDALLVHIDAEVTFALADGSSQSLVLELVGVETADANRTQGLESMIGSTLAVERDQRRAVLIAELDVESAVGSTTAETARRSLRAPLLLPGPLPTVAVGVGASWELTIRAEDGKTEARTLTVVALSDSKVTLEVDGEGISGTVTLDRSMALPSEQSVEIDGTLVVVSAR